MATDRTTACVLRRTDGKFYRGPKWWRWTRSWRRAAVMTWSEFVGLKWFGVVPFDGEILNLSDVALEERK